MMRTMSLVAVVLCGMFLTGCAASPERVLTKASLKSASEEAGNYKMEGEVKLNALVGKRTFKTITTVEGEVNKSPDYAGSMKMSVDMGSMGKEDMDTYVVKENDMYVVYMKVKDKWTKQLINQSDLQKKLDELGIYDTGVFADYQNGVSNLSMVEESVDGKDCYKIKGTVSLADAADAADSFLSNLSMDSGSINLASLSSIKICYWIEKKTYLPVKITMDMRDMMQDAMEQSIQGTYAQGQVKISDANIEMKFHDYGSVGSITLPEEAKGALLQ